MAYLKIRGQAAMRAKMRNASRLGKLPQIDVAMRNALEPMREMTQNNALALRDIGTPIGGHLDQGVVSAKVKSKSAGQREWWVSFKNRARKIAHLVEFGTSPHDQPRRGIRHPGARPKPFFTTAFESTKGDTLTRLGRGLWTLIVKNLVR